MANTVKYVLGKDFDEFCLFPMECLRVTQGIGFAMDGVPASTYSHKYQTAYDLAGADTGKSPVFAPFSCKVMRIYNGSTASSRCNFTWYMNTKRVMCADGKIRKPGNLFMMTAHCDNVNMTKYGIKVGAMFQQWTICGYEGVAGASGAHSHVTFGEGNWDGHGWHEIPNRRGSYEINNPLAMHHICFLKEECKIINDYKYPWQRLGSDFNLPEERVTPAGNGCFPAYKGDSISIAVALAAIGSQNSYDYRCEIAKANSISDYHGTAAQNRQMLTLLKTGQLIKPTEEVKKFPKYVGNSVSIVTALKTVGAESSYSYRCTVAKRNGVDGYKGTAEQNSRLLSMLKSGTLIVP